MPRESADALERGETPEVRRHLGQTPLLDSGVSPTPAPRPTRRRRVNLIAFFNKQIDKTPPVVREHLQIAVETLGRICRSGWCWLAVFVVCLIAVQGLVLQYSSEDTKLRPHSLAGVEQLEVEGDMDSAYRQWQALQEANPNKFGNFSKFLMDSKHKESRLRKRISALSDESLNRFRNIVVPPAAQKPNYTDDEEFEMIWTYLMPEKSWPYVGSERYLEDFRNGTRKYYNSLAVFPNNNRTRLHGLVGIWPNGTRAWIPAPMPPPIKESPLGAEAELKDGGFYLKLSNALTMDREMPEHRMPGCIGKKYDLAELDDASVVIVFYNEHLSTLLRTVHSVLNNTPPPILREIILVDDHSNATQVRAGGILDDYAKLLPKVKILRLPERRGIVQARVAGAKIARAPNFVMLDSHVEVAPQWLEPMLARLKEQPKAVVFPQIFAIDPENFELRNDSGIGTFLSFKWMMQERPYFDRAPSIDPVPSPSLAGGLFAVNREWFFDIGGYDDEFKMWGAENVEMGFRYWQCGGRVEGIPCSITYHIFRHGGSGYKSPGQYVSKNRRRTAILWTDRYYQLAKEFLDDPEPPESGTLPPVDLGSFEKMKAIKKQFRCKSFDWFLKNVDPKRATGSRPEDYGMMGEIRNLGLRDGTQCLDSLQHKHGGKPYGLYSCHHLKGSQGWFEVRSNHRIRNMASENLCLSKSITLSHCDQDGADNLWLMVPDKKWIAFANSKEDLQHVLDLLPKDVNHEKIGSYMDNREWQKRFKCLGADVKDPVMRSCDPEDKLVQWDYRLFKWDPDYTGPPEMEMPDYSPFDYDDLAESEFTTSRK